MTAETTRRRATAAPRRPRRMSWSLSRCGGRGGGGGGGRGGGGGCARYTPRTHAQVVHASAKIRSCAFQPSAAAGGAPQLVLVLTNNMLEAVALAGVGERPAGEVTGERAGSVALPGHRNDVRAVALSEDDSLAASASAGLLKVWSTRTRQCARTMDCGFGLAVAFGPSSRHIVVGCRDGTLQLFEVTSGDCVQSIAGAHEGAIWSIAVRPDGRGFATGSADKSVKFWECASRGLCGRCTARSHMLVITDTRPSALPLMVLQRRTRGAAAFKWCT